MKPYGLKIVEFPDVEDILSMGAKSSCGTLRKSGGEFSGYCRSDAKAATRRYWKRQARRDGKSACSNWEG
jgi:hypothetical protein